MYLHCLFFSIIAIYQTGYVHSRIIDLNPLDSRDSETSLFDSEPLLMADTRNQINPCTGQVDQHLSSSLSKQQRQLIYSGNPSRERGMFTASQYRSQLSRSRNGRSQFVQRPHIGVRITGHEEEENSRWWHGWTKRTWPRRTRDAWGSLQSLTLMRTTGEFPNISNSEFRSRTKKAGWPFFYRGAGSVWKWNQEEDSKDRPYGTREEKIGRWSTRRNNNNR